MSKSEFMQYLKENMRKLGIPENELSIQNAMCVALVQQALNGSISAFKTIWRIYATKPKISEKIKKKLRILHLSGTSLVTSRKQKN